MFAAALLSRPILWGTDRLELEVPALELPTTPGAVRNLLGVGFACFQIVEIHALVCASETHQSSPQISCSSPHGHRSATIDTSSFRFRAAHCKGLSLSGWG